MSEIDFVWKAIPNSSQWAALSAPCDEILYHGTRGPGKTDCQLMRFAKRCGLGYGSFWKGVIFDHEYKNLGDVISKSKRWFDRLSSKPRFLSSNADLKWVWETGEELLFRAAKDEKDYDKYHGHEYPFIGINELTKYPTPKFYDAIKSVNRSSFRPEDYPRKDKTLIPPIPLEMFSTTNPHGPGHNWVKRRFIDAAPDCVPVTKKYIIKNPITQTEEEIKITQVAIFGSIVENPYIDPKYVAKLMSEPDKHKRKAWLEGSWDIVAGGALDDVWDADRCVLPRFRIPASWRLDRSYDDGSSHPFSVGFWAEANGEEAIISYGNEEFSFCPAKGSLIQFDEIYGADEVGENKGNKTSSRNIAKAIKKRIDDLTYLGWIEGKVYPGPADNRIRSVIDSEVKTTEDIMLEEGISWEKSDKSPGSRVIGLELIRDMLISIKGNEKPGLYFMENCRASIATLPTLPRDEKKPDDVDTNAEDHAYDMVRYRVMKASNRAPSDIKVSWR